MLLMASEKAKNVFGIIMVSILAILLFMVGRPEMSWQGFLILIGLLLIGIILVLLRIF
jgi:hypothetical protein